MTIILILLVVYGSLKDMNSQKNGGRKNGVKIAAPLKYLSNFGDH